MTRFKSEIKYSSVTPRQDFMNRRQLVVGSASLGLTATVGLPSAAKTEYGAGLELTSFEDVTGYNNFYEFGTDKGDPAKYARALTTDPWSVEIGGLVNNPGNFALEDILKDMTLEERIYRFRCVEAWSMVVPWVGFQLSDLIAKADPQGSAKYEHLKLCCGPRKCMVRKTLLSLGLMSKVCVWMRRCIRLLLWQRGCMVNRCQIKTARLCAWLCLGNTGLNQ